MVVWLLGKLFFYGAMATLAIAMLRLYLKNPFGFVLLYTFVRFLLGVFAGLLIWYVWEKLHGIGEVERYALSFGALRYVEWLAVLALIALHQRTSIWEMGWRGQCWVVIGVAGNILLDRIAIWTGLTNVRFYC